MIKEEAKVCRDCGSTKLIQANNGGFICEDCNEVYLRKCLELIEGMTVPEAKAEMIDIMVNSIQQQFRSICKDE
jgi:ribosomal protein L37AE/L43A